MIKTFLQTVTMINHLPNIDFFGWMVRGALCIFAIFPAVNTIVGSVTSAVVPKYTRLALIQENTMVLYGISLLINIPTFVNGILSNIPFVQFKMEFGAGYQAAFVAHMLVVFAQFVLFVDNFAPPIAPARPDDDEFRKQLIEHDQELADPFGNRKLFEPHYEPECVVTEKKDRSSLHSDSGSESENDHTGEYNQYLFL